MTRSSLHFAGLFILLGGFLAGCETGNQITSTQCAGDYSCMRDMAFQYRHQAEQLNALAQRYEQESITAAKVNEDSEEVKHQRALAQQYSSQAKEADELAQQYRRQLPHNMMY